MTARAPSGTAPSSTTPAGNGPGSHEQAALAPAVTTRARPRRYAARDLWALAAALAGPLAASGVLLPSRASWSNTNVALLLVVVVVVAVAAVGNRAAGALAAVGAAVWFDFFFTLPYYRLAGTVQGVLPTDAHRLAHSAARFGKARWQAGWPSQLRGRSPVPAGCPLGKDHRKR